jgi:hypothetical protein
VFTLPVSGARWYLRATIQDLCRVNSEVYCVRLKNAFAQNSPLSLSLALSLSLPFLLSILFSQSFFLSPSDNKSYFNMQKFMRKNPSLMQGLNP